MRNYANVCMLLQSEGWLLKKLSKIVHIRQQNCGKANIKVYKDIFVLSLKESALYFKCQGFHGEPN